MKKKTTIVCMVLVLAVLLAAGLVLSNSTKGTTETEKALALGISVGDTLQVGDMTFLLRDGSWVYEGDPDFPLSQQKLADMKTALEGLEAARVLTAPGALAQYGLEPAQAVVTTGGKTLSIGTNTAMSGGRYFSMGDGKVYITQEDILTPFQYDLLGLAQMETAPRMERLESVTLTRADGTGWTIRNRQGEHLAYSDSILWFLDTPSGPRALDTEQTESLFRKATDLEFTGCAAFKPTDLAALGLDKPTLTVTVQYSSPQEGVYTLEIGNAVSGKYYARIRGSNTVYWMDAVPVNALRDAVPADLTPDEVLSLDLDTVTELTVSIAGETWQFTPTVAEKQSTEAAVDTTGQTELRWLLDGRETTLGQVLDTVTGMTSTGSAEGLTPTLACELSFTFRTTDPYYPTVTLGFHRYTAKESIVTLNDVPTVTISRENAAALYEAVTAVVLE